MKKTKSNFQSNEIKPKDIKRKGVQHTFHLLLPFLLTETFNKYSIYGKLMSLPGNIYVIMVIALPS